MPTLEKVHLKHVRRIWEIEELKTVLDNCEDGSQPGSQLGNTDDLWRKHFILGKMNWNTVLRTEQFLEDPTLAGPNFESKETCKLKAPNFKL